MSRMCDEFGISEKTFYSWRDKYPEFDEAVRFGRDYIDKLVENALLKSALGYVEEWEEVTKEYKGLALDLGAAIGGESGDSYLEKEIKEVTIRKTKKKQVFKPDVSAIKFWLVNRRDANWKSDKIIMKHSGNVEHTANVKPDLSLLTLDELKALEVITAKLPTKEIEAK